ncbi:MAG TPA: CDP-alcohol phosphatidyltransferase family protein [Dehalococcoidia bacterium]|nr:CDP-alcohol phosphatidyltransferase family protein [Dehalococcoidia bacterium]
MMAAPAKPASLDGLVSRWLNRPLSRPTARLLAHTSVTPNQITLLSALIAGVAGLLLAAGHNVWGGIAIHISSVVDGVDGDLARLSGRSSRFGAVLDAVLDRYADAAIFGGMAWWAYRHEGFPAALLLGLVALTGAFAVSYSRARIEASAGLKTAGELLGLGSRDVRLLLAALGCVLGQVWPALALVAVLSHATVLWRLIRLARTPPA